MNKNRLKEQIDLIVKNKRVDEITLRVETENQNLTRFAGNRIIQNVTKKTNDIYITAFNQKSTGTARTQDVSKESLLNTLKRAEEIAQSSPEDPEFIEYDEDGNRMN